MAALPTEMPRMTVALPFSKAGSSGSASPGRRPTMATSPPGLAAVSDWPSAPSPMVLTTLCAPPFVASNAAWPQSGVAVLSITRAAPIARSRSALPGSRLVIVTSAPAARANCSANSDTLPVPRISTREPAVIG